jgi:hypothetical protein
MNKSLAKHQSFISLCQSGKRNTHALVIYQALLLSPRTIVYFRETLKIPHQSCTGTLSHLEDIGWVYKDSTVKVNKKSFTLYKAETDKVKAFERMRSVDIYKKGEWLKRGYKNGWFDKQTASDIALQLKINL